MNNFPPGVSASHPYFNPPTSPCCRDSLTEHDYGTLTCDGCGESVMTAEDHEWAQADLEIDRRMGK